jgi:hypothetical protein
MNHPKDLLDLLPYLLPVLKTVAWLCSRRKTSGQPHWSDVQVAGYFNRVNTPEERRTTICVVFRHRSGSGKER